MNFTQFINAELLAVIPLLNLVGGAIKKSKIDDKYIPLILGILGILISCGYTILTAETNGAEELATALFTGITQGLLCAAASVYANQLYKQTTKDDSEDK